MFDFSVIAGSAQTVLSAAAAILLLVSGIGFTCRFRAFWLRHPIRTLAAMPFENGAKEMLLSLGGTIGVGNISGVAVALLLGGAGSVFWMWIGAFFSMALKYAEIALGVCTKKDGYGGAPVYIRKALGKGAGGLFAALLLFDSTATGGIIQSSAISEAADGVGIPPLAVGLILCLLAGVIFFFGADLFRLSAIVVPLMSVGYVLSALVVIAAHADGLRDAFHAIFSEAFSKAAAGGGFFGILLSPALRQGIVKGLFSNEAGCGTAPTAHAQAKGADPARQGLFGVFEVFADTVLMCTLTALAVLLTLGEDLSAIGGGGVRICADAFRTVFGGSADVLMLIFVSLFAFATVISFGWYGVRSLDFFKNGGRYRNSFLIVYCLSLLLGAVAAPAFVWTAADMIICLMLLINIPAVICCRKEIFCAHDAFYKDFSNQTHMGKYAQSASRTRSQDSAGTKNAIPISDMERKRGSTS